jgi:nitrogen fixation protein FixH
MNQFEKHHPLVIFLTILAVALSGMASASVSITALVLSFAYIAGKTYLEENKQPDIRQETEKQLQEFKNQLNEFAKSHVEVVNHKLDELKKENEAVKQQVQTVVGLKTTNISNLKF